MNTYFHSVRVNTVARRLTRIEHLLCAIFPFKDIGWDAIGEEFTRFTLLKTRWGNVYLHRLKALTAVSRPPVGLRGFAAPRGLPRVSRRGLDVAPSGVNPVPPCGILP